jgi:hypothetical protein
MTFEFMYQIYYSPHSKNAVIGRKCNALQAIVELTADAVEQVCAKF